MSKEKNYRWKIGLFRRLEKSLFLAKLVEYSSQWSQPRPLVHAIIYFFFIRMLRIDLKEAQRKKITQYRSVLDFFTRKLDEKSRPIEKKSPFCSPCDGTIVSMGTIKKELDIKNTTYTINELIPFASKAEEKKISKGKYAVIYLSPRDYHRVHMPTAATLQKVISIGNGRLPVNDFSLNYLGKVFAHNHRVIFFFDSPKGSFVLVMVGALNVGKIILNFDPAFSKTIHKERKKILQKDYGRLKLKKGEELATFALGSTTVLFCTNELVKNWNKPSKKTSKKQATLDRENLQKVWLGKDIASVLSSC